MRHQRWLRSALTTRSCSSTRSPQRRRLRNSDQSKGSRNPLRIVSLVEGIVCFCITVRRHQNPANQSRIRLGINVVPVARVCKPELRETRKQLGLTDGQEQENVYEKC